MEFECLLKILQELAEKLKSQLEEMRKSKELQEAGVKGRGPAERAEEMVVLTRSDASGNVWPLEMTERQEPRGGRKKRKKVIRQYKQTYCANVSLRRSVCIAANLAYAFAFRVISRNVYLNAAEREVYTSAWQWVACLTSFLGSSLFIVLESRTFSRASRGRNREDPGNDLSRAIKMAS